MPVHYRRRPAEDHLLSHELGALLVGGDLQMVEKVAVDDELHLGLRVLAAHVVFEKFDKLAVEEKILQVVG